MNGHNIEQTCRAIGRRAAANGKPVEFAMKAAVDAQQRMWIRQGHDYYRARFSDRRAA